MSTIRHRIVAIGISILGLLAFGTNHASVAGIIVPSDEMQISDPAAGVTLFDNFIPELGPSAGEPPLTFTGGPVSVPPPTSWAAALALPGVSVVVLTEPALDPGEPPIIITGPNGQVFVSDVVISTLTVPGPSPSPVPPFISFVSDGPDLEQIATLLPGVPGVVYLPETGFLQDVSAIVAPATATNPFPIPIKVLVQSDIPEPSTFLLGGLGLVFLFLIGRRPRLIT